jgi:hypothetical protein
MTLEAPSVWQSTWKTAVPPAKDDSWKENLAKYIDARLTGKLTSLALFSAPGVGAASFTFGKSAFKSALSGNSPALLANAVEAGLLASTISVEPNAFIEPKSPATTFSVVQTSLIDPPSIALVKAAIIGVSGLPGTKDASQSQFPVKLREAFLLLTFSVVGLDSKVPPAGPLPLTAPFGSLG